MPKQWAPAGRDVRAELASGALELVETSGSTGERLRILWDEGWWMRQEARAMRTNDLVAAAMDGARGAYREAILTTPACGLGTCHIGDLPYTSASTACISSSASAPTPCSGRRRSRRGSSTS